MFVTLQYSPARKFGSTLQGSTLYLLLVMGMLSPTAVYTETCLYFISLPTRCISKPLTPLRIPQLCSKGRKGASPLVLNWRPDQQEWKTPLKNLMTTIDLPHMGNLDSQRATERVMTSKASATAAVWVWVSMLTQCASRCQFPGKDDLLFKACWDLLMRSNARSTCGCSGLIIFIYPHKVGEYLSPCGN